MVSALHHEGKRLYELAREGITVERAARQVSIDRLVMTSFQIGEHPSATLEVTCSTGTYIRTLAADIGTAAGTGAMMRSLRRVWVGENEAAGYSLTSAWTLDQLREKAEEGTLSDVLLPLDSALRSWPQIPLDAAQETRIRHGQRLALTELTYVETLSEGKQLALLDGEGALCAVARVEDEWIAPVKVLQRDATV
jgi:tRNA pseudouridine55 synthase